MKTQNRRQELADVYHELIGREEASSLNDGYAEVLEASLRLGLLVEPKEMAAKVHSWWLNSISIPHFLIQPITLFWDFSRRGRALLCVSEVLCQHHITDLPSCS